MKSMKTCGEMAMMSKILILVIVFKCITGAPTDDKYSSEDIQNATESTLTAEGPEETDVANYDQDAGDRDTLEEPSEIVETYALPEESVSDKENIPLRSKRRRRRRRRKQLKPMAVDPKELESYYLILEEDANGKPISYTLTNDLQGINNQKLKLPRQKMKQDRPYLQQQQSYTAEINHKRNNFPFGEVTENTNDRHSNVNKPISSENEKTSNDVKTISQMNGKSIAHNDTKIEATTESKQIEYDIGSENPPTRKVDNKNKTMEVEVVNSDLKINQENKINRNEVLKLKYESTRIIDASKKENYKIRRLPPISTILQGREQILKNETQNRLTSKYETETLATNENISDNIQTSTDVNNVQHEFRREKLNTNAEHFNQPDHDRTEHNRIPQTTSMATKSTTFPNTFDNTAFIYISCNHSLHEILKNKFNFTGHEINYSTDKYIDLLHNHHHGISAPITEKQNIVNYTVREKKMIEIPGTFTNAVQDNYNVESLDNQKLKSFDVNDQYPEPKTSTDYYSNLLSDFTKIQQEEKSNNKFGQTMTKTESDQKSFPFTSTLFPNFLFNNIEVNDDAIDKNEFSLYLRNSTIHRTLGYKQRNIDRKKLSLAVKSGIIISGGILALAILSFFVLLLSCKIRQEKLKMKCHSELYEEHLKNSELRQSFRSTTPVVKPTEFRQSFKSTTTPVIKTEFVGRSFRDSVRSNLRPNMNYW